MKPSPRESALGFTKDHHPVPSYTPGPTPPSTSTSPQQLLSSHDAPRAWHRFLVRSPQLPAQTDDSHESGQPSSARALLNNLGTAGTLEFVPATHDRDWTVAEQPNATHRRIKEAGDSVPPGLRDEGSSEPAHLGSSRSTRGSASPATVNNEEL